MESAEKKRRTLLRSQDSSCRTHITGTVHLVPLRGTSRFPSQDSGRAWCTGNFAETALGYVAWISWGPKRIINFVITWGPLCTPQLRERDLISNSEVYF